MVKLTRALFAVLDVMSVMMAGFALATLVAIPIVEPVYSRMAHKASSGSSIAAAMVFWALIATACYMVRRHHVGGLILAVVAAVIAVSSGSPALALVTFTSALLCGVPFGLVLVQAVKDVARPPGA